MSHPSVVAVSLNPRHTFSKLPVPSIHLLEGAGVEGDAHCGPTVRHRYLVRRNPAAPNRTQVHLLEEEFFGLLSSELPGLPLLSPGEFGENVTTRGVTLVSLPLATRLHCGPAVVLELTGLRSPCVQMNSLRPGLMKAAFDPATRSPRAGVMAVVLKGGDLCPGDTITAEVPAGPHLPLRPI